ncbi:MAG: hypothetical protein ACOC5T_02690 [Elusimicrobiota bacterium]
MKVRDVIKRLQDLDPTGEIEVCIGESDIFYISMEPAYYDGLLYVLKRDVKKLPYYDVTGMKIISTGKKISLKTMDLNDVLVDNWQAEIEYDVHKVNSQLDYYKNIVSEYRKEGYMLSLDYDAYPCKMCKYEPTQFITVNEECKDCYPANDFKNFEEKTRKK